MKRLLPYTHLTIFLITSSGVGMYWWKVGRYIESTDNAYIRGDITPISAKISGYVEKIQVSDNQVVSAGEPLLHIESLEYRVRLERGRSILAERQAALQVAKAKTKQHHSHIDIAKAELSTAKIESKRFSEELDRYQQLYAVGYTSPLEYGKVVAMMKRSQSEKKASEAKLSMVQQELYVLSAEEKQLEAEINQHRETLKLLQQEVADTEICAPISGTIGNRRVRSGQYVRPGSILMAIIPLHEVWVEANFKEVQLARIQIGHSVEIKVDAFPGQKFAGQIQSFSPASGAEFSLLPPENASGNFTKIVQRIPVRILLDATRNLSQRFLPGMSVEVSVDTRMAAEPLANNRHVAGHSDE